MMETILATYNAGRWLVTCPIHGTAGAVLAEPHACSKFHAAKGEYICPVCFPGITAQMTVVRGGRVETIPDRSARATARKMAEEAGQVYDVVFPDEKQEIESILSERPPLMQNWAGRHETMEFLREENKIVNVITGRAKHGI